MIKLTDLLHLGWHPYIFCSMNISGSVINDFSVPAESFRFPAQNPHPEKQETRAKMLVEATSNMILAGDGEEMVPEEFAEGGRKGNLASTLRSPNTREVPGRSPPGSCTMRPSCENPCVNVSVRFRYDFPIGASGRSSNFPFWSDRESLKEVVKPSGVDFG